MDLILFSPQTSLPIRKRHDLNLASANSNARLRWIDLLGIRESWGLVIAKFLSDAAWYFYLFWLPKYLYDARGFDIKAVGTFAWIPYAAAGVGCLLGGWFSSYLVRRRFSLGVARKLALGLSAAVMPSIVLVPRVPVAWAIVIFSIAYFGQQSWSTLVMILPTDLFPAKRSRLGGRAGRLRRRHGRNRIRATGGIPARPRIRLRRRILHWRGLFTCSHSLSFLSRFLWSSL